VGEGIIGACCNIEEDYAKNMDIVGLKLIRRFMPLL